METGRFRELLQIAKDLGVRKFKIEDSAFYAEFSEPNQQIAPDLKQGLQELLNAMPSDRALLNLDELPDEGKAPK